MYPAARRLQHPTAACRSAPTRSSGFTAAGPASPAAKGHWQLRLTASQRRQSPASRSTEAAPAAGTASASENAAGTTATVAAPGLNLLGFYPGELVNISGFANQPGFNGAYKIAATSGNTFSYADVLPANVTDTNGTAFPALEETNAGVMQIGERSMVNSLVVVFNDPVTIAYPAVSLQSVVETIHR